VTVTGASEGGAYGAALTAGVGADVWPDLPAALGRLEVDRTFTPDPGSHERYDVVFAAHSRLHEALTDVYALVASADE
jgi:xylulokinase